MVTRQNEEKYKHGLFIFHRDLRIHDNKALNKMMKVCDKVLPVFIFTPSQVNGEKNKYKSLHAVHFMIEALGDLQTTIPFIQFFYGDYIRIVDALISSCDIDVIGFNQDVTPFAMERTQNIEKLIKAYIKNKNKVIDLIIEDDYYLCDFKNKDVIQGENKPYVKFSAFYKRAMAHLKKDNERLKVVVERNAFNKSKYLTSDCENNNKLKSFTISLDEAYLKFLSGGEDVYNIDTMAFWEAHRENALSVLKDIKKGDFRAYEKQRNRLTYTTTQLSAFIKFGLVSIREVAYAMKGNEALFRQLIWRDFYAIIMYYIPRVLNEPFQEKYKKLKWVNNPSWTRAWEDGKTGFPIVDACMTQLNSSGFMHNRGRLIVSSFLVKLLQTNWQRGERYFATQLVDYDPCSNNGNWQWVAGTGTDMMPYFRIFNPWSQSEKYDPDAAYIKHWLPQLASVPPEHLHQWDKFHSQYDLKEIGYVKPIVDYKTQRVKAFRMYKSI